MKRELLAATAIGSCAFVYSAEAGAQVFNWTGFYVGAVVGYGSVGSHAATLQPVGAPTADLSFPNNVPTFNPASPAGALSAGAFPALLVANVGADGLLAGGAAGYNWQKNHLVYGLETDFVSFRSANESGFNQQNLTLNGARSTTGSVLIGTDWLYTLRGRIGYAQDRLLIFGTGGLALGQTRLAGNFGLSESNFVPTPGGFIPGKGTATNTATNSSGSQTGIRAGYTVGGGFEYALTDHVTVKLEGLYYDLGTSHALLNGSGKTQTTNNLGSGLTTTATNATPVHPRRTRNLSDGPPGRLPGTYKF